MNPKLFQDPQECWRLGATPLHPADDPYGAACTELEPISETYQDGDILLVVGCGLGWHIKAVQEMFSPEHLLVYEPDPDMISRARDLGNLPPDLKIFHTPEAFTDALAQFFVYGASRRITMFSPGAYTVETPELPEQAKSIINDIMAWATLSQVTRFLRTKEWLTHLVPNTRLMSRHADITHMAGRLTGIPAVVVGAGPSLDQSMEDLAFAKDRALVLACASALGPMAKHGLKPHFVLAGEAKDESRQFVGRGLHEVGMIACSTGHPNHFAKWPGPKTLFHVFKWLAGLTGGVELVNGGHITSTGFSLAVLMGCNPIILLGQDLAYHDGERYAKGRVGAEDCQAPQLIEVKAVDGGTAHTTITMKSFIMWYEETLRLYRSQMPSVRFVNATRSGAYLEGFEHCSVQETLADWPKFVNGIGPIMKIISSLPPAGADKVKSGLMAERQMLQDALDRLKEQDGAAVRRSLQPFSAAHYALSTIPGINEPDQMQKTLAKMLESLDQAVEQAPI